MSSGENRAVGCRKCTGEGRDGQKLAARTTGEEGKRFIRGKSQTWVCGLGDSARVRQFLTTLLQKRECKESKQEEKRCLTFSVYILFPLSSSVYIKCMVAVVVVVVERPQKMWIQRGCRRRTCVSHALCHTAYVMPNRLRRSVLTLIHTLFFLSLFSSPSYRVGNGEDHKGSHFCSS